MGREERVHQVHRLLQSRRSIDIKQLTAELEVSVATAKRYIDHLRDRYQVPVTWDRSLRAYRLEKQDGPQATKLTGLYFNASEIHALLTMDQLLRNVEPGLL